MGGEDRSEAEVFDLLRESLQLNIGRSCIKCGEDDWVAKSEKARGLWRCRPCLNKYSAEYKRRSRRARGLKPPSGGTPAWSLERSILSDKYRRDNLRKYGMTVADYENLWQFQGGRCAVCWNPEGASRNEKRMDLAVHHDHVSGKVIALCCAKCNPGMGMFNDDPALMRAAAKLMEDFHERNI